MSEFVEDIKDVKNTTTVNANKLDQIVTGSSIDAGVEDYINKFLDINEDAKQSESADKQMGLLEGIRTYKSAAFWSIILSTALVMEGYDTNLLGSMYAMPAFQKRYGHLVSGTAGQPDAQYQVAHKFQTSLSMSTNVGEIIGLAIAGVVADKIGYRWTLIIALCFTTCFIFIVFFARNIGTLLAGEFLLGIPWGAFQTLTVSYASEVCPLVLRVYLTTYVNMCWVFGQLISSGVLRALVNNDTNIAYRIPFAVQWVWPIPIMIGIFFAPDSPWWLVRKGRLNQAKKSLGRLMSKSTPNRELTIDTMVTKMQLTIAEEFANTNSKSSFYDCIKPKDFRRTRVAAIVWIIQQITGSALIGYSTYFYEQAGLSDKNSFNFSIIQYCLGIMGTVGSWFASRKMGRFDIYFGGLVFNSVVLIIIGGLGCSSNKLASWGIGSLLLVYTFIYDLTIGPLCYCIVAEIPSTKLRTKTIIIARNLYNVAGIVTSIITPYMLNPDAWNWKAKTGFFWGGFSIAAAIWCYFELPETKGKTFAELDTLFAQKVGARKFKHTEVDVFNADELIEKMGKEGIKDLVVVNEKKNVFDEKI